VNLRSPPKIVVLGMMAKMPVGGVVWQTLHYLIGLRRLGYDVYYVETHGVAPTMMLDEGEHDGSLRAAAFLDAVLRRFDLEDRWAFVALHGDGQCHGLSDSNLAQLYGEAELIFNLHGGTEPLDELCATDRLVYVETDPVNVQIELAEGNARTTEFLDRHCAFFTFGENLGRRTCTIPVPERYRFRSTRQPVVLDFWRDSPAPSGPAFTTVASWRQPQRDIVYQGELYTWSKHDEFLKILDLPSRTEQPFELALGKCDEDERRRLQEAGWSIRDALDISRDPDEYRRYIGSSRGEFTVAKDQNVRFRTGWFSDRSATYLAAGRPVVTQETGFSHHLPTGAGLFAFTGADEALGAIDAINTDYEHHSRAARAVAREWFDSDIVLPRLLAEVGV
jgi:hypothetical protein